MTTETAETTAPIEAKVPGTPDRALNKATQLATANVRIAWALDGSNKKISQFLFPDSGMFFEAENNTLLIAVVLDDLEAKSSLIEELQNRIEQLEADAAN